MDDSDSSCFDKHGRPISHDEWFAKLRDLPYRLVARTELSPDAYVSTVWLGFNHNFFNDGPPLIFETLAFPNYEICRRYATLEEARRGHEEVVRELQEALVRKAPGESP